LGKYFRKVSEVNVTLSRSLFFSSPIMARITSMDKRPSWLNFLSRWAWEREGVAYSLSIASKSWICSSFLRKDSS